MPWPAEAYAAADKLTKNDVAGHPRHRAPAPAAVLAGAFFNLLNLAGIVAAIVYLVDVRPAMSALTRR